MERLILLVGVLYIHGVANFRRILIIISVRIQSFFMRSPIDLKFERSFRIGRKVKIRLGPKKPCKLHIGRNVNLEDYVTIELRGGELFLDEMAELRRGCYIKVDGRLHVEEGPGGFSYNCAIHCGKSIHIGKWTHFGEFVSIYDGKHTHNLDPNRSFYLTGDNVYGPIEIGRSCLIGSKVSIMMGVTIGDCCIISNGSMVKDDIPSYSLAAGTPAKVIKVLKETDESTETESVKSREPHDSEP